MPTTEANCYLVILELSSINSIIRKAVLPSFLPSKLFTGYFSEFTPTFAVLVPCKFGALSPYRFLFRAAISSKEKRLIHTLTPSCLNQPDTEHDCCKTTYFQKRHITDITEGRTIITDFACTVSCIRTKSVILQMKEGRFVYHS